MPNGKPGDHPYTDVVIHGMSVFGPVIGGLIRNLADTGEVDEGVKTFLYYHDPRWQKTTCDYGEIESQLRKALKDLKGSR